MQRSARSNLILLGIASLLGLVVYWQISRETARFEPPLSALDPALVQRVAVNCHGCPARRFERRHGHWQMLEPFALPADDAMVDRLVGIVASPVRSRRKLDEFDSVKIGLDPPMMRLQIDDEQFDIGMTDALLGDRYVRSGNVVAMVPDRFSPYLIAAAESELDRHLVPRGSVLASVRIDGVDMPELADAWSLASAVRIRAADAIPQRPASTRIELNLADGSVLDYVLDRSDEIPVAWRAQVRSESASRHSRVPLADTPDSDKANECLGFELDPAQIQKLLGQATTRAP